MANPDILRDLGKIANTLSPESPSVRIRFGSVVSVQASSCTVSIAGSTTQIAGVRFLTRPTAGFSCVLMTDGADMFVLGQPSGQSGTGLSYSPTLRLTSAQNLPTGATATAISFSSADGDTQGHWSAAAPTLLTIKSAGRYVCYGSVAFSGVTTPAGIRNVFIEQNSSTTLGRMQTNFAAGSNVTTNLTVVTPAVTLAAGDTLRLMAQHTQGATLTAVGTTVGAVWLSVTQVGG